MDNVLPDSMHLPAGTRVGRYALHRRLGVGGMGAVYEGVHEDLGKRVAIKLLHPQTAESAEARARFLREGRALARIRHPHVAEVFDVGQEPTGLLYLVMELLEGESLGALLERRGRLSEGETADIMIPLCAAVDAAHREGIIHRDLKPENIFLSRDAHGQVVPKVLDFGISKVQHAPGEALTGTQRWMGTPQYMSPEQAASGREVDARTDVYALGVVLYECVCGELPYPDDDLFPLLRAIVEGEFKAPRAKLPEISTEMEALILRAMARSPGARFDDAMVLGRTLLPFASQVVRSRWESVFADIDRTQVRAPTSSATSGTKTSEARTLVTPDLSVTTTTVQAEAPSPRRRTSVYAAVIVTLVLVTIAVLLPSPDSTHRAAQVVVPGETAAPREPPTAETNEAIVRDSDRPALEDAPSNAQGADHRVNERRDAGPAHPPRTEIPAPPSFRAVGSNRAPIVE